MFEAIKEKSVFFQINEVKKVDTNCFLKVDEKDIALLEQLVPIPNALLQFWHQIGYGFLTHSIETNDCTSETNRLMDPLSIYEILKGKSEQVDMDFQIVPGRVPFFERFSGYFIGFDIKDIHSSCQPVYWYWQDGEKVADSIEEFISKLSISPDFMNALND